jgi:hypothetical protein
MLIPRGSGKYKMGNKSIANERTWEEDGLTFIEIIRQEVVG